MMDSSAILAVMNTAPELAGEWAVESIAERIYRARSNDLSYLVKWIKADDPRGQNEIEINRTFLPGKPISAPQLIHVIPSKEGSLVVWEWVEGDDLRYTLRELLPEAFRQLGSFHLSQRGDHQLSSPITGRLYATIHAFVEGETHFLCASLSPAQRKRCCNLLSRLSCGYPTFIHGDMHPGNLLATANGPMFVDWGYSHWSINLLDLDYICSIRLQPLQTDWWIIQPEEAGDVLAGYYSSCGMPDVNIQQIHHAVMLWAVLWALYNSRQSGNHAAQGESMLKLEQILEAQL